MNGIHATISIQVSKYLTFVNSPPRSSFKKLFMGTDLGKAQLIMSEDKALPKGLEDEEVERGRIRRPHIPYIPPEDPIQESVEKISGTKSFKVTLPDGTAVYHKMYDGGPNKAFIIHVKEVLSLIKRKSYNDFYDGAKVNKDDYLQCFRNAQKKSDNAIADPMTMVDR